MTSAPSSRDSSLMTEVAAEQEKRSAALTSVLAAIILTSLKLGIGSYTNSLGILSEAAHSGLDLLATLVTLYAIHSSMKPADEQHHYGHGKIENLSALFETSLLLVTCGWILYESVSRLFFRHVAVDPSLWAFIIMAFSIIVDYSRSRILLDTARKYKSQALEADALHFRTDIWSSAVVILGLIGVWVSRLNTGLQILGDADAIAAVFVAAIIVYVSARLGARTIYDLMDSAPEGLKERIRDEIEQIPGIYDCHRVRVRTSGGRVFVDVHVCVDEKQSLEKAHQLSDQAELAVKKIAGNADVVVHVEPASRGHHPHH